MAVTVYKSTDTSAPTLTGTAGSLITVLDAVLVNGYGSKTAAGWTKPFSATNGATYRPGSGVQHYFHVDDNSPNGTALGKEAQFRGSETATAFQTGTGFFPTAAQFALGTGLVIRKSTAADATARAWTIIADDRTCYIFALTGDVASTYFSAMFGEFYSLLTSTDSYRSLVIGRVTANNATAAVDRLDQQLTTGAGNAITGHYMPRGYTGLGTAIACGKWGDTARGGASAVLGGSGLATPEPVSGALHVAPVHLGDTSASINVRGRMRGLFHLCHPVTTVTDGDTITGSGAYAGRTFLVLKTSANSGSFCLDITGAWETN